MENRHQIIWLNSVDLVLQLLHGTYVPKVVWGLATTIKRKRDESLRSSDGVGPFPARRPRLFWTKNERAVLQFHSLSSIGDDCEQTTLVVLAQNSGTVLFWLP